MKILFKTLCDLAFTSSENGKLNIIGIFDDILASAFPVTHPKMSLVMIVEDEPGKEFKYHFDISDSSGKKLIDTSSTPSSARISLNGKINIVLNVNLLTFNFEGVYTINFHTGKTKETLEFAVKNRNK